MNHFYVKELNIIVFGTDRITRQLVKKLELKISRIAKAYFVRWGNIKMNVGR
jgi:hypothetical protein